MADKSKQVYELLGKDHPTFEEFKILLENAAPGVLSKRFLSSGLPYVFKDQPHKYLAFREAVGKIFKVPPQNIAVMGSARFGFSTSPQKQSKGGAKPLDEESDMDLVLISPEMYQSALESFARFAFNQLRGEMDLTSAATSEVQEIKIRKEKLLGIRRRAKALYFGYVNPVDLEDDTPEKQLYYDMQQEAATQLFGTAPPGPINRVGVRVYRDWNLAERAYEFSFKKLAAVLGLSSGDSITEAPFDEDESPTEHAKSDPGKKS